MPRAVDRNTNRIAGEIAHELHHLSHAGRSGAPRLKLEHAKVSALGDRADNQDRAAVVVADQAAMMLVFDGMGGHADGALAAETGIRVVQDLFMAAKLPVFDPQGFLYLALARAHEAVVELGASLAVNFRPRATCAACLIQESGAWWAHIGDSRIYHVRDGRVLSRSRDHSHVEILVQEARHYRGGSARPSAAQLRRILHRRRYAGT